MPLLWILILLLAVGAGAAGTAPTAAPQRSVRQAYQEGEAALASGNLSTAERAFREVLAHNPRDPGALANLGVVYMRRKQWPAALRQLHAAEKLAPKVPGIRLNIGLAYYHQNDFRSAIPPLASVVRDQPDAVQARYLLGLCYLFTADYARVVQALEPAFEQESYDLNYLYVLGIAAHKAKLPAVEERALGRLVAIGNDAPEFHLLMGKAYLNREEYARAVQELQRAASQNPRLPFLHFTLGSAYLKQQQYQLARDEFLKDIAIEPDLAYNYDQLGDTYEYLGDDLQAQRSYREAVRRDPHLVSSYLGLAKLYQKKEDYRAEIEALEAAGRIQDSANLHYMKGQALRRLGRLPEAKQELQASTRIMEQERRQRQRELNPPTVVDPQLAAQPQ